MKKNEKDSISMSKTSRIFPRTLPDGFSVELNTLQNALAVLVRHRPDEYPLYPSMGEWGLTIPEMIATSKGFCLGGKGIEARKWMSVPEKPNTIQYKYRQEPPVELSGFGGSEAQIDKDAHLEYTATLTVDENTVDVEVAITNLSDEPMSAFTHLCNRFTGRGYSWGWRDRTYIQIDGKWIVVPPGITPSTGKWFLENNLPDSWLMEFFRKGSSVDPNARVTSPLVCMVSEDRRYTMVCGSPQGSMVFINPDNPCLHSEPYTPVIEPRETVIQKWSMRVYKLPLEEAVVRFESEVCKKQKK